MITPKNLPATLQKAKVILDQEIKIKRKIESGISLSELVK